LNGQRIWIGRLCRHLWILSDPSIHADHRAYSDAETPATGRSDQGQNQCECRCTQKFGIILPDLTNTGAPKTREEMLAKLASVRQQIDANLREDPTAAYHARLAQLRQDGGSSVAGGMGTGRSDEFMDDGAPRLLDDETGTRDKDYSRFDSAEGERAGN
jgi:hypothetical protein